MMLQAQFLVVSDKNSKSFQVLYPIISSEKKGLLILYQSRSVVRPSCF